MNLRLQARVGSHSMPERIGRRRKLCGKGLVLTLRIAGTCWGYTCAVQPQWRSKSASPFSLVVLILHAGSGAT